MVSGVRDIKGAEVDGKVEPRGVDGWELQSSAIDGKGLLAMEGLSEAKLKS
jgi:hypothetical protein